ncbi:MAG TPA: hypothetical protein VG838_15270 [Opitutaceae bacterium]|nr:hypothetical protein [Opitutaceae bacterium]
MLASIDTRNASAVAAAVKVLHAEMFPGKTSTWLGTLFCDVEAFFTGRHPDYQAADLRYHDLEHTLQATLCFARLMAGRHQAGAAPQITSRQFELGLAGVLLHDTGYLKLRTDTQGTGAKYTYTHVLRSCAFAAAYLPRLGANITEVQDVLAAISCTGPRTEIARMDFRAPVEKIIGCSIATADYLGQLAAPDYPGELEILFHEFEESDNFYHVPSAERAFHSAGELIAKTPGFWTHFVRPKLENDFQGLYRFLADPYPHGPNPYLEAIEQNIAEIRASIAADPGKKS